MLPDDHAWMNASPMNPTTLIFVYGTLRRGGSNHFRMDGCEFVGTATVTGTLHRVAWFPGLVLDPDGRTVSGEIYRTTHDRLPALDDYEGPEYRRLRTTATDAGGMRHDVWIWEWKEATEGLAVIPTGDWLDVQAP